VLKIRFFLKNPGIYEMVDGFGVNLRGFTTISIKNIKTGKNIKRRMVE